MVGPGISRRRLLAGALGAAAVGSLGCPRLLGRDRVRLGLIGAGAQGQRLIPKFEDHGAEFVAIADPDEAQLGKAAASASHNPALMTDFRHLIDLAEVDAVVVATPDHWHALATIYACQAGKDVYVEKPLATTVAEGRAIVEAATRTQRIVQIGTQQRGMPHYAHAVERVKRGELGTVDRARIWGIRDQRPDGIGNPGDGAVPPGVDYDLWLGPAPARPFNVNRFHGKYLYFWDYAGGALTGFGIHDIDTLHWLTGLDTPTAVSAVRSARLMNDARETPDNIDALIEYPGLTLEAHYYDASDALIEGRKNALALYGSQATLVLDRSGYEIRQGDEVVAREESDGDDGSAHVGTFLDAVRTRKSPASDALTGHRSTIPALLANVAHRLDRKLVWDPQLELFTGDAQANALLTREYRSPWQLPSESSIARVRRMDGERPHPPGGKNLGDQTFWQTRS